MLNKQQLKNLINKKAINSGLPAQQLYGLFAMDQLVSFLSKTHYSDYLILKGGFLLTAAQGLNLRATGDIDFTITGFELNESNIIKMIDSVQTQFEQPIFEIVNFNETREDFNYNGLEVKLIYHNDGMRIPFNIDFTTGEDLIKKDYQQNIISIFTGEHYSIKSYPIEQVITDKFYTLLAYGELDDTNSRMKDYYDLYILTKTHQNLNIKDIDNGLSKIMNQRNNYISYLDYEKIIQYLKKSETQRELWERFSGAMPYANNITYEDAIDQIQLFAEKLIKEKVIAKNNRNNDLER